MTAYMLQPLVEQDLKHTLLLRNVERAFMGDREPEGASVQAAEELSDESSAQAINQG